MKNHRRAPTLVIFLFTSLLVCSIQPNTGGQARMPPYKDPSLPIERRVDDLVSRMTLEEKVSQMMNTAKPIERLGIPGYDWWNEALHGVARAGIATVFPQAIGLGATWDVDLIHNVAVVISDEARAKYHDAIRHNNRTIYHGLTFWSPNINIFRDPRWGRGQETYGEDPYLTSRLGVAFVKGMQGDDPRYLKTVSTPKHYAVHSGPEPERHRFDAKAYERDLRETYLPAFRATVVEGKAASVMCAYNRTNGEPCCANSRLLTDILRNEWGFNGYVVSDCGAIADIYRTHHFVKTEEEASAVAVKAGTDLSCGREYASLVGAVKTGLISEAEIDRSVKRLLTARFRLGMFDPPEMVPYARIPFSVNDSPAHRELALKAARESIVLLKNENNFLPLKKDLKTIAVIGPNADTLEVLLGNYNGTPSKAVTPLVGIRNKVPPATKVLYAQGATLTSEAVVTVPSAALISSDANGAPAGLKGEYFANRDLKGEPIITRIDRQVNFDWSDGSPAAGLGQYDFSVRWMGKLVPPETGEYLLGATADDGVRVYLDNRLVVEDWSEHAAQTITKAVNLEGGRSYEIRVEYYQNRGDAVARLVWGPPHLAKTLLDAAVNKVKESDLAVMVLGLSPNLEGEEMSVKIEGFSGGDRTDLRLPTAQEELLKAVYATGKPVVLVLLNGSALAVNWADDHVAAILEAWYPGEEGGTAIADALFGDYSPGGRLPITFYKSIDQLPRFEDYSMEGRTYRYFKGEPLYPFGYGLSYTKFRYSKLKLSSQRITPQQNIQISVDVENVGERAGDEVVQLYVTDVAASVPVPIRSLRGVERIHLNPKEKRRVSFTLGPRELSLIDNHGRRVVEPGEYRVAVGGKQPGFTGSADAVTTGVMTGRFVVTGKVTEIPEKGGAL